MSQKLLHAAQTNFREQSGCHDCGWRFQRKDERRRTHYYCTFLAPERPPSGDVEPSLEEEFQGTEAEKLAQFAIWDEWAWTQEVVPWGICDAWIQGEARP